MASAESDEQFTQRVPGTSDQGGSLEPVTERILRRLAGPRWAWILLWSAIPLVSPLVLSTVIRATGRPFGMAEFLDAALTQAGLAWACLVLLVGSGNLAAKADATRAELVRTAPTTLPDRLFAAISRVDGPVALTAVVALIATADNVAAYGLVPPLVGLPLFVVYMLPILTFTWVYVVILIDIYRLGELPLVLDRFPQDRTMGLGHIGSLASNGLAVLLLAAVPVLLVGSDEPVTLLISLSLVVGVVVIYGLSMWRLHRQMAAAKGRHVAMARRLYADAYAPIRDRQEVESLAANSSALSVAQSLDERAAGLPTWPIDEGTARFVVVVITGVITSLIVRALFAALGF